MAPWGGLHTLQGRASPCHCVGTAFASLWPRDSFLSWLHRWELSVCLWTSVWVMSSLGLSEYGCCVHPGLRTGSHALCRAYLCLSAPPTSLPCPSLTGLLPPLPRTADASARFPAHPRLFCNSPFSINSQSRHTSSAPNLQWLPIAPEITSGLWQGRWGEIKAPSSLSGLFTPTLLALPASLAPSPALSPPLPL